MSLTKKGALLLTHDIDRLASVLTAEAETLGLPEKVASGFAEMCDRISDRIERKAGLDPEDREVRAALLKNALSGEQDHKTNYAFNDSATWDAESIGEEVSGSSEGDADESSFMGGEFSQQEFRELRERQESGSLPSVNTDPRSPRPGIQAGFKELAVALKKGNYTAAEAAVVLESIRMATDIAKASSKAPVTSKSAHGYNLKA